VDVNSQDWPQSTVGIDNNLYSSKDIAISV
jgi:hypothetical protein